MQTRLNPPEEEARAALQTNLLLKKVERLRLQADSLLQEAGSKTAQLADLTFERGNLREAEAVQDGEGPSSSPTTLSSCAALALLTLLVNAGSLYRGGKGT